MSTRRTSTPALGTNSSPAVASNLSITQDLLARYQQLALQVSEIQRERNSLKRVIKALLAAGARVEFGELTARLQSGQSHPLNFRTVRQLFVEAEIAWMKSAIKPITTQRLVIEETPGYTPIVVDGVIGGIRQPPDARRNRT